MEASLFSDIAIVSCGTLSLELNHLKKNGFLDVGHLFFTTPGLHENPPELERYMAERLEEFLKYSDWMGIPIQPYSITLDRLKSLLQEQANSLNAE